MTNMTGIDPDGMVNPIWGEVRVLVAAVHYGDTEISLHSESMFTFMAQAAGLISIGRIVTRRERTQPLDWSRSRLAWEAMHPQNEYTHLFFYDTDIQVTLQDIEKLLMRRVDLVSGTYFMGAHKMRPDAAGNIVASEAFPCVASRDHKYITRDEITEYTGRGELIKVDSVGCGCLLVTSDALRRIGAPAFKHNWVTQGSLSDIEYEDGWFSRMARTSGLSLYMDPTVRPEHYKMCRVGFHIADMNGNRITTPKS